MAKDDNDDTAKGGDDEEGKADLRRIKYKPTMFVPSKSANPIWKGLDGTPVDPIQLGSMRECKTFIESYGKIDNYKIYGNNRFFPKYYFNIFNNNLCELY